MQLSCLKSLELLVTSVIKHLKHINLRQCSHERVLMGFVLKGTKSRMQVCFQPATVKVLLGVHLAFQAHAEVA